MTPAPAPFTVESQNPQTETVINKFPGYFGGFADKVRYRYGMDWQ